MATMRNKASGREKESRPSSCILKSSSLSPSSEKRRSHMSRGLHSRAHFARMPYAASSTRSLWEKEERVRMRPSRDPSMNLSARPRLATVLWRVLPFTRTLSTICR